MRKGIVMEMDEVFLTLLTPDGEFLRARKNKNEYSIGEEILFFPVMDEESSGKFAWVQSLLKKKRFASAALVLLFLSATLLPLYQSNHAYAYMSIDVNPSIELGVNKKMQVVEANAYNRDGKRILAKVGGWEKKDLAAYTEKILAEIKKQGYLTSNHSILISTVRTEKSEKNADSMLAENLQEIKSAVRNDQLDLTLVQGTEKDLEKAHKLGITTGKYKVKEFNGKKAIVPSSDKSKLTKAGTLYPSSKKEKIQSHKKSDQSTENPDVKKENKEKRMNEEPKQKHRLKKEDGQEKKQKNHPLPSVGNHGERKSKDAVKHHSETSRNNQNQKEKSSIRPKQKKYEISSERKNPNINQKKQVRHVKNKDEKHDGSSAPVKNENGQQGKENDKEKGK